MNVIERLGSAINRRIATARRRSPTFDHCWRAQLRYGEVLAGRLAAAIAYYGFFAVFAIGLVAYSIFGVVLQRSEGMRAAVDDFLGRNLPFIDLHQIQESSGAASILGLILLAFTGIGWVEAIRSSQRLIYRLEQQPGNLLTRRLIDLAVLVGLMLLLGLSVAAIDALESLLRWLLSGLGAIGVRVASWLLSVLVNTVLAAVLLVAVPRLRISARRLLPPLLVVSLGITLLNTVGRFYVVRTERNPAYTVVAGAVGLLLYLYLLNRLLLFGAALAATSTEGRVVDLAAGRPPAVPGAD